MYKRDPGLGEQVRKRLKDLKLLGPMQPKGSSAPPNKDAISAHFQAVLLEMNLDVHDPSIEKTSARVAKMYVDEIFHGLDYNNFPACMVQPREGYDEMVCEKGITVHSMCEHHFVPFIGRAAVAYIPAKKIIGLSKLNRIVDFFCRRPQVQERLTAQICRTLQFVLESDSVAVVIQAEHLCVKLRGAKDQHSDTVTSMMMGKFRDQAALRAEFLALSRKD